MKNYIRTVFYLLLLFVVKSVNAQEKEIEFIKKCMSKYPTVVVEELPDGGLFVYNLNSFGGIDCNRPLSFKLNVRGTPMLSIPNLVCKDEYSDIKSSGKLYPNMNEYMVSNPLNVMSPHYTDIEKIEAKTAIEEGKRYVPLLKFMYQTKVKGTRSTAIVWRNIFLCSVTKTKLEQTELNVKWLDMVILKSKQIPKE